MIFKSLREEIDAIIARDPAARSRVEVVLTYPSFHVLLWHRMAHAVWIRGWHLLGRLLSNAGRLLTGIEIHPGAKIGRRLFIDHGMGVVIGETTEVGDDVTMYHDVTLGGVMPSVDSASQIGMKRHPTLRDHVIIGSGAQVLGPITVGEGARIGANAVVTKDIPAGVTAVGNPARLVMPRDKRAAPAFVAYGTPTGELSDPYLRALEELRSQLGALQEHVAALEGQLAVRDGDGADESDARRRALASHSS
jgi:serine O-acetyltransferase